MRWVIFFMSLLLLVLGVLPVMGGFRISPPDVSESRLRAIMTENGCSPELQSLMDQAFRAGGARQRHLEALLMWVNLLGISGGLTGMVLLARYGQASGKP